ncbi:MAG: MoaD/ThiS family protein [Desulfobacteraceae bacterium]
MKIKLFGALGLKLPQLASPEGVEIELPDGSTAGDLLKYLKIPDDWGPAVTIDSRLLKHEDLIRDGAEVRIFQAVHGG